MNKRFLSFLLSLAMVISMMPAVTLTASASTPETVYVNPAWTSSSASAITVGGVAKTWGVDAFSSIQAAQAVLNAGDFIQLQADVTEDVTVTSAAIRFNLNGKQLTGDITTSAELTLTGGSVKGTITVTNAAITIIDLSDIEFVTEDFDADSEKVKIVDFANTSDERLLIDYQKVTFSGDYILGTDGEDLYARKAHASLTKAGTADVTKYVTVQAALNAAGNGDTITLLTDFAEDVEVGSNLTTSGYKVTIDLNGHVADLVNYFSAEDPNFKVFLDSDDNTVYTLSLIDKDSVAVVDGIGYTDLKDAVAAGITASKTVKLVSDVDISGSITVNSGESLTLDLNGYVLNHTDKYSVFGNMFGNLEVIDSNQSTEHYFEFSSSKAWTLTTTSEGAISLDEVSSETPEGTIVKVVGGVITGQTYQSGGVMINKGDATFKDINFVGVNNGYSGCLYNNTNLLIEDCVFAGNWGRGNGGAVNNNAGTMTIKNTKIIGNMAKGRGGGAVVWKGTVKLEGNVTIRDNGVPSLANVNNLYVMYGSVDVSGMSSPSYVSVNTKKTGKFTSGDIPAGVEESFKCDDGDYVIVAATDGLYRIVGAFYGTDDEHVSNTTAVAIANTAYIAMAKEVASETLSAFNGTGEGDADSASIQDVLLTNGYINISLKGVGLDSKAAEANESSTVIRYIFDVTPYMDVTDSESGETVSEIASSPLSSAVTFRLPVLASDKANYGYADVYHYDAVNQKDNYFAKATIQGDETEGYYIEVTSKEFSQYSYVLTNDSGIYKYKVNVADVENGTVSADSESCKSGTLVTVTVTPDKGWTLETITVLDKSGAEVALKVVKEGETFTFTMPSGNVTVSATFMEDNTMLNYFVDVTADDYFYDAVLWAVSNDITAGLDELHFGPSKTATRAQMVTFLWNAAGKPVVDYAMSFTDVAEDAWYAEAVRWAVSEGITAGTSETTFSPNATVTRAQAVTFLWNAAKAPKFANMTAEGPAPSPFEDVATDAYYYNAVLWAKAQGITAGTSDTTFSPDDQCVRAQIVTFLYNNSVK